MVPQHQETPLNCFIHSLFHVQCFFSSFTDARNYDNNFSVLLFFSWSGQRIQHCNSKSWFKDWLAWGETLAHPQSYLSITMRESRAGNETREAWPKGAQRVMRRRKAKERFSPLFSFPSPLALPLTALSLIELPSLIVVNSRNKMGEERRRQTLCDNRDNIFVWKNNSPNYTFLWTDRFVKGQKTLMLREYQQKNSQVIALSRLSHTSVLASCSSCLPVA